MLDSWVRYESQVKQRQQKELAESIIAKVQKELESPKVLQQILQQSVADVESESDLGLGESRRWAQSTNPRAQESSLPRLNRRPAGRIELLETARSSLCTSVDTHPCAIAPNTTSFRLAVAALMLGLP